MAVQLADQQGSKAAATGSQASRARAGAGSRAGPTGKSAEVGLAQRGGQATLQDRVLAKLGLSKGAPASKAGQQGSKAAAALQSAAAPSGESSGYGRGPGCGQLRSVGSNNSIAGRCKDGCG